LEVKSSLCHAENNGLISGRELAATYNVIDNVFDSSDKKNGDERN